MAAIFLNAILAFGQSISTATCDFQKKTDNGEVSYLITSVATVTGLPKKAKAVDFVITFEKYDPGTMKYVDANLKFESTKSVSNGASTYDIGYNKFEPKSGEMWRAKVEAAYIETLPPGTSIKSEYTNIIVPIP